MDETCSHFGVVAGSRLYAIVDREALEARGMELRSFVEELREAGVRLVQYRDKVSAPQEILRAANGIAEVFEGVDATLILNDRADLAVLAGWDGVHVGQGDLPVEAARRVLGGERIDGAGRKASHPAAIRPRRGWGTRMWGARAWDARASGLSGPLVGVSTHTEEQVRAAQASTADYVAVGPVFRTGSKADAEPVVGLEGVRRARALTTKPLMAIGGITLENAWSVVEAGADSVAVIGGLFSVRRTVREVAGDFLAALR